MTSLQSQAARVRRRSLVGVLACQFLLQIATMGMRVGITLMVIQEAGMLGLSGATTAGVLMGLFGVLPIAIAMPGGRWVDRVGFHKPMRTTVMCAIVGCVLAIPAGLSSAAGPAQALHLGLSPDNLAAGLRAALLAGSAVCLGVAMNVGTVCVQRTAARMAMQVDEGSVAVDGTAQAAALKRVFSWMAAAPSASNAIGPMAVGATIDLCGYGAAFALMGLFAVATWACVALVAPERPAPAAANAATLRGWAGVRELLRLPGMRPLLLLTWLIAATWDLFGFLVPLQGHEVGLSASAIGTVLGTFAIAILVVRLALPVISDRMDERRIIAIALTVMATGFFIFPWARSGLTMALAAVVVGAGLSVVQPMLLSMLYLITPPAIQGAATGFRIACVATSGAVMPVVFGLLGGALGSTVMFRAGAAVMLAAVRMPMRINLRD